MTDASTPSFAELGLIQPLLDSLQSLGYEAPSPIQAAAIPPLLEGKDILGQAQTGTGKTAAFALPLLQRIDLSLNAPQTLVLAPTRELAIQVAEAFQRYARHLPGLHVLPIYGGQGFDTQLRGLKRGVHIVVGTPGRVMDHMRRGKLKLEQLKHLVLDEADEMLRMGFIDDVEWILSQTPEQRQVALFSATMPRQIAKVADTYLREPVHVKIKMQATTAETIEQRYWPVAGLHKLDALTRILEAETFDAMIIFVRTKTSTVELAEKLEARGYRSAALNGDISQQLRERTVDKLKNGQIDILVATDVAARGLDVERISHVLNYDIPYDTEAYVHRIGRTGRAGRTGQAILFAAKREMRMLHAIEKATGKRIEKMALPTTDDINSQRVVKFKEQISATLDNKDISFFQDLLLQFQRESDRDPIDIAAALAHIAQGEQPFLLENKPARKDKNTGRDKDTRTKQNAKGGKRHGGKEDDVEWVTYRVDVGKQDGLKPDNLVGAIANEAGIDSEYIGRIALHDDHSTVQLPPGMPKAVFKSLRKVWVCQKQLNIQLVTEAPAPTPHKRKPRQAPKPGDARRKSDSGKSGDAPPRKVKRSKRPERN